MDRARHLDVGAILFGVILLAVGAYYLATNTFGLDLPALDWDQIWPLAVIALGIGIVWRALMSTHEGPHEA